MPRGSDDSLPPSLRLPALVQTFLFWRWPLASIERCHMLYGDRFTVYPVDMRPLVFLSRPAAIRDILTAPADALHPGVGASAITPIIGETSFMLLEEASHQWGRKSILPSLQRGAIDRHAKVIAKIVAREVESWPLNTPFPLEPCLRILALRLVLTTIFGGWNEELQVLQSRLSAMLRVTPTLVRDGDANGRTF
jgi:cytochrome P450